MKIQQILMELNFKYFVQDKGALHNHKNLCTLEFLRQTQKTYTLPILIQFTNILVVDYQIT